MADPEFAKGGWGEGGHGERAKREPNWGPGGGGGPGAEPLV